jgi:hypothetical protein
VPDDLSDIRHQLALANRMLANEGVLDAFGIPAVICSRARARRA